MNQILSIAPQCSKDSSLLKCLSELENNTIDNLKNVHVKSILRYFYDLRYYDICIELLRIIRLFKSLI